MVVLMPCAGLYKRYPQGEMPKYIRPLNDMRPMFQWALDGVRELSDKYFFAVRKSDEDEWGVSKIIADREPSAKIMVLEEDTKGPADTVYQMLNHFEINESFLVHDCDCTWKSVLPWNKEENCIAVGWRETAIGDRSSKSWVFMDDTKITKIEEKKTLSDWYCCGGYQFNDPTRFKIIFEHFDYGKEVFCSHIIQAMVDMGTEFTWNQCKDLNDWGTWEKYTAWRKKSKVYFFDLDGTICEAGAPYGKRTWADVKLLDGVKTKIDSIKENNGYVVIISSRTESATELTKTFLYENRIQYDKLILGVPNGTRVMINDYANSNPYPVVEAINTKRNTADWVDMI